MTPEQDVAGLENGQHRVTTDDTRAAVREARRRFGVIESAIAIDQVDFVAGANEVMDRNLDACRLVASEGGSIHSPFQEE